MAANQGDVDIQLGDDTVTLKCTLGAAKEITARFGDFSAAVQRLAAFDLNAYIFVVAKATGRPMVDVEKGVFRAGVTNLVGPVSEYVMSLARGGQPVKVAEESDTSGEG